MAKQSKSEEEQAVEEANQMFGIPLALLQAAVTKLAEQPYNDVGNLVNQLRALQPLEADE